MFSSQSPYKPYIGANGICLRYYTVRGHDRHPVHMSEINPSYRICRYGITTKPDRGKSVFESE